MNFEEALRIELGTISSITNKIFPLNAIEGTKTPYVIYISSEGMKYKTFNGFYDPKEISLELNIVHSSYGSMKALTRQVIDLVLTFEGRLIGGVDGVYISSLSYEMPTELFEYEVNLFRTVLELRIRT
jgi:hypothetical protein